MDFFVAGGVYAEKNISGFSILGKNKRAIVSTDWKKLFKEVRCFSHVYRVDANGKECHLKVVSEEAESQQNIIAPETVSLAKKQILMINHALLHAFPSEKKKNEK